MPNLTRRAWNVILLACIALSSIGVYIWSTTGKDGTGLNLDLDLDLDLETDTDLDLGLDTSSGDEVSELPSEPELFRLADLGQEAEDRYHLLGEHMDE